MLYAISKTLSQQQVISGIKLGGRQSDMQRFYHGGSAPPAPVLFRVSYTLNKTPIMIRIIVVIIIIVFKEGVKCREG